MAIAFAVGVAQGSVEPQGVHRTLVSTATTGELEPIIAEADADLYRGKDSGRDQVVSVQHASM